MIWTRRAKTGAVATLAGVAVVTIGALYYFWSITRGWTGLEGMSFVAFAAIFGAVLLAIGLVMAFFIVMIIRKNEAAGKD